MEKKTLIGFVLILLAFSANFQTISSDAADCYDGCSTACVYPDVRLSARCNQKCSIRCSPDVATAEQLAKSLD